MNGTWIRQMRPALTRYLDRFSDCFLRKDTRAHMPTYVEGQLSNLNRKSVEPIALAAGVPVRTLQEFLAQYAWDEDAVRDRLQQMVLRNVVASEPLVCSMKRVMLRKASRRRAPTSVVWQGRQDRQLHRDGSLGLCPRRLPLPARW